MDIRYVCEICGYQSTTVEKMRKHEAMHFGLTADEYHEWAMLTGRADFMAKMCGCSRDTIMDKVLDDYVQALIKFEKKYNLVGQEPLKNCIDSKDLV